jgi:hypothetical protein
MYRFRETLAKQFFLGFLMGCSIFGENVPTLAQSSSQFKVANLPDGIYAFLDPFDKNRDPRRFEFRKSGDRIIGYYISADNGVCIEGSIRGNIITGKGLEGSEGYFSNPQAAVPYYQRFTLQEWDRGNPALKVGRQVIFNLPSKSSNESIKTGYVVWWRYLDVELNLDGYERRDNARRSNLPQECQIR